MRARACWVGYLVRVAPFLGFTARINAGYVFCVATPNIGKRWCSARKLGWLARAGPSAAYGVATATPSFPSQPPRVLQEK